jgi:hypothetical protein
MSNLVLTDSQKAALNQQGFSSSYPLPSAGISLFGLDGMTGTLPVAGALTVNDNKVDFAIPLIGVLGNCEKLLPLFLGGFRLDLTADAVSNFLVTGTVAMTDPIMKIDSLEFVCNIVSVDPGSMQAVISQHPDKMFIRTQTYTHSSQILQAQSGAGLYELMVSSRVSSMKSLLICCSPTNAYEKMYAGVNPNATAGTCVLVNNIMYPQNGMNPSNIPSDVQAQNRIALNSLYSSLHTGLISRRQFCKSSAATGACVEYADTVAEYTAAPNAHYVLIDTEVFGRKHGALLSGIDTKSGSTFLRYVVGATLANTVHVVNMFAVHDVILEVDLQSRQITRRV